MYSLNDLLKKVQEKHVNLISSIMNRLEKYKLMQTCGRYVLLWLKLSVQLQQTSSVKKTLCIVYYLCIYLLDVTALH